MKNIKKIRDNEKRINNFKNSLDQARKYAIFMKTYANNKIHKNDVFKSNFLFI